MTDLPHTIGAVLNRLEDLATGKNVTLGDLIAAFGERSFVPALMIPALLVVSPLSGIPLFSSICGLTISLISIQILAARKHLWLPDRLKRRQLDTGTLTSAIRRIRGPVNWIDRHSAPRLGTLFQRPLSWLTQISCVLSGAIMPFLELVPFSSSILGTAVLCFSVGFLTRDGVFMILGAIIMAAAYLIPLMLWNTLTGT